MNEALFFVTLLTNFVTVVAAYKFFGKYGVYAWIAIATVIANIEVLKCVDIFSMPQTLGNVTYGTIFLATDILSEKYGAKSAQKGVFIGFFALLVFTIMTQIDLLYVPNSSDFAGESMKVLFTITPRICFASMFAYFVSNTVDIRLFEMIKQKLPSDKFLWLRNNGATMTAQIIDTFLFTYIGFSGVFGTETLFKLFISTYLLKFVIAIFDTPFLYAAKKIKPGL